MLGTDTGTQSKMRIDQSEVTKVSCAGSLDRCLLQCGNLHNFLVTRNPMFSHVCTRGCVPTALAYACTTPLR